MNKEEKLLYSLSAIKQVIGTLKDGNEYVINAYNEIKKCVVDYVNSLQPYKFDDLKPGMWVWDDKLKTLYKIKKIMHCHWFKAEYRSFVLDVKTEERKYHTGIMEFEEGRFYPVIKATGEYKNEYKLGRFDN